MEIAVIDSLGRAGGDRYSTFDVVGAGPRIVAGIAEKYGSVSYYTHESATRKIREILEKRVVLISAMSSDATAVNNLVLKLRRERYGGLIVVGGPISFDYYKLLKEVPVDFVVVGEGEIPLEKWFKYIEGAIDLNEVPALAYRDPSGSIRLTSRHVHTPKEVLSALKPWTRVNEGFDYPQIYRFYVEVVRGCSNFFRPMLNLPGAKCIECLNCRSSKLASRLTCPAGIPPGCGFCSVPYIFGPPRSREIKSVVEEVEELVNYGARRIVLSAPDFLDYGREELVGGPLTEPCSPPANIDAIEGLLNQLNAVDAIRNKKAVLLIENIKACLVTEEVGRVLGRYLSGSTVHIGLETCTDWFNDRVLGKPITFEQVLRASKILKDNGLRPYVYLMYGLPMASRSIYVEMRNGITKLWDSGVEKVTLYKFIRLPGTAFSEVEVNTDCCRDVINDLKRVIAVYNTARKRQLLGRELEVYLLERDGRVYGYPVLHGPVVFVATRPRAKSRTNLSGCRGLVKVTDFSQRFVRGVLIKILECPGSPQIGVED